MTEWMNEQGRLNVYETEREEEKEKEKGDI